MKQGWEIKKLGEVCDVKGGATPLKSNNAFWDNGTIPWFTINDIREQGRIIHRTKQTITELAANRLRVYPKDTVLLCCTASVGEYAITKIKTTSNQQFNGLIIRDKNKIKPKYLFHFVSTLKYKLLDLSGKTTIDFVSAGKIKSIDIPVPLIPEQERIVGILDSAFAKIEALRANAQQNLQNAKDLFQSSLKQEFTHRQGWNKCLLKDVSANFSRGKSKHRPRNDKRLFGGDYPFIQTGEIRNANKYVDKYSVTYNEFGLSQSKLWNTGTVCITIAANIAETAILNFESCFPDSIIGISPDTKKTSSDFLYYLLQYSKLKLQELGKGSAQDNINLGTFENMLFSFPLLKEQQMIVEKLDALSKCCRAMEENYRQTIAHCNALKQTLLTKAFNGEL